MGEGWNLYVVPRTATYRPEAETIVKLMAFLAKQLEAPEGYTVNDGDDELSAAAAGKTLAKASTSRASSECSAYTDEGNSEALFGWDPESDDPDENYWADGIRVQITSAPKP